MTQFRYSLNVAPSAFNDGSGCIGHDINVMYSVDSGETWAVVPARHKTVLVPSDEMQVVMDMPDATGAQKSAKAIAYKQSLVDNLNTQNVPITGWSIAQMEAMIDANNAAAVESDRANTFITATLEKAYPVTFNL